MKITTIIKLVLAVMLFICLLPMPYGYYELVRFTAMAGFGILAFTCSDTNKKQSALMYLFLAILFQPFFKISLGRELWNIVDVIVGVALLISLAKERRLEKQ